MVIGYHAVEQAMKAVFAGNCSLCNWFHERGEGGDSFDETWEAAVHRVMLKLDASESCRDDVNDLLAEVTAKDDLESAHADGLAQHEWDNNPALREAAALAREIEAYGDRLREERASE
ncbi:hypothetical protein EP7_004348 [Isosphaeraceae bacterium EP7]